jgi:sugar O-acyltransferase (sialic acid O-acetyltransferase NeuD family)
MSGKPVIVFGDTPFASMVAYCLMHDSPWTVAAFTAHQTFIADTQRDGLPVVPFETITATHPPGDYQMMIALGQRRMNDLRAAVYRDAKRLGYECVSYVSSRASVWANVSMGDNCMVFEHVVLQPFVRLGDNVIVRGGAHLSHHCTIGDHVFIGAGVTMAGQCTVGDQAFLGVGAVLRDRLQIAARTLVGAGSVILRDTEADQVYLGNPARKTGTSAMEASSG